MFRFIKMDLEYSEEHLMIRSTVKEFVDKEVLPYINDYDQKGNFFPPLKKMADLGLFGITIPYKYGGSGMDYICLAIACEELERGDSSLRVLMSVHTGLIITAIYQWGTEDQKSYYLPKLCSGELIGTFGLTEASSGSDVGSIKTKGVKKDNEYILSGEKTWISMANKSDVFLIIARTDDKSEGIRGLSAFIVDRNLNGVSTSKITGKLGVKAGDTGTIYLNNVKVSEKDRLGIENEGFKIAMSAIDNGRFTVAAGALGIIKASIEESVKYCKQRKINGKDLGKYQLIQEHLAYMQSSYDTSELLVLKAACLKNQGRRNTRESSMAKWCVTENALDAANRAIQIYGANGYSNAYPLERMWRNVRASCIYEGTTEIHKLIQASYTLGYRKDKSLRCELPKVDH